MTSPCSVALRTRRRQPIGSMSFTKRSMSARLARHLPSGHAVDRKEAAEWAASAEGERFVALSSERWCEANIAAGADHATA